MRRTHYLALILLLIAQTTFGQVYQNMAQPGYKFGRARFDSVLTIPSGLGNLKNISGGQDTGQIRFNKSDSSVYVWNGRAWIKAGGGTIPTLTQVLESAVGANEAGANQIKDLAAGTSQFDAATFGQLTDTANLRLRISDTATMLSAYARSAAVNLKLNISDTASMLAPYSRVTVSSYGKNATADSTILLLSNGTRYAAKDSVGGGGGGASGLNTVMGIDSTTTRQLLSTQKIVTKDSTKSALSFSQNSVIVGDSITLQTDSVFYWGNSFELGQGATGSMAYVTQASSSVKLKTVTVNKGISSTRLSRVSAGDSSFIDRLYTVPNYRTTIRYIVIGNYAVNDCNLTTGVANYSNDLLRAIDTLLLNRLYPAKRIVLFTPGLGYSNAAGKTIDTLRLYANATIDIAKAKGVILVDVFNEMIAKGGRSLISSDSIHPNNAGHTAIAEALDIATGSARVNGTFYSRRFATLLSGATIGGSDLIDGDQATTGIFKVKQNANFLAFNGSTSNSIFQLSSGTASTYLRLLVQSSGASFVGTVTNVALNFQTNAITRYALSGTGTHTLTGDVYGATFTGAASSSATTHTYTATSPISAFTVSGNNTDSYIRFQIGTLTSTGNNLEIGQNGTASRFTGGANKDYNIYGYHASNTSKLFIGVGNANTPSIVITPTNNNVNIGTSATEIPSAILNVNSTTKGLLIPRMTLTQRNAIASPAAGLQVIVTGETGGEFLSFYNSSTAAWQRVVKLTSAGRLLLGTTTEGTNLLDVNGTSIFRGAITTFPGMSFNRSGTQGNNSIAIGVDAVVTAVSSGDGSISIAGNASGNNTIAIAGTASANNTISIGAGSSASASDATAIGRSAIANGAGAVAVGKDAQAAANEFVSGFWFFPVQNVYFGSGKIRNSQAGAGEAYTLNGSGAFGTNQIGGNITIAGGKGTGSGAAGDVVISTSTAAASGTTLQTLTNRWWVKGSTGQLSNTSTPNASAALNVESTTQGVLFPRMTTAQKTAIASPTAGLVVYDTTLNKLCVYTTAWETITSL